MKSVSIIIPNWNGEDLLRYYLPSVLDAKNKFRVRAEVIVVDDCSTDQSVGFLRKEFPRVRLIIHNRNQGFGKACWSGARAALHPVLLFLNTDVKVDPNFIEPLVSCFENPHIFSASPLIFDEGGKLTDATMSIPYFRRGKIRYRSYTFQDLFNNYSTLPYPWYTLFPLGAAFAVDRERFLGLQGFDDIFNPFYYEDNDLGFRAWRRGWQCIVVPESRVIHCHKGTIARSFKKYRVRVIRKRNRLLFLWKNLTSDKHLRQHFIFQILRLCYRPFCLDATIHVATILAIPHFIKSMRKRRLEKDSGVLSEEKIFQIINSAHLANRQMIETTFSPNVRLTEE
jgi:GT2 family glycosyltransferase